MTLVRNGRTREWLILLKKFRSASFTTNKLYYSCKDFFNSTKTWWSLYNKEASRWVFQHFPMKFVCSRLGLMRIGNHYKGQSLAIKEDLAICFWVYCIVLEEWFNKFTKNRSQQSMLNTCRMLFAPLNHFIKFSVEKLCII